MADVINPFFFLQPYSLLEDYSLQGRDDEASSLLALLKWKDIIVVYGKSGVGKTSFVNHTLSTGVNRVSWLPIRVTRSLDINKAIKRTLQAALSAKTVKQIHEETINKISESGSGSKQETTGGTVQLMEQLYLKWNRPIYLIVDQLEELFLIGEKDEQKDFLDMLQDLMDSATIQKKVILVLREEHLAFIQEIEPILTGVFQDALPIKEIKRGDAEKVYKSLLELPSLSKNQQSKDFRNRISDLKEIETSLIEKCIAGDTFLAQKIQVFLFLLWEKSSKNINSLSDADILGHVNELTRLTNPLRDYLESTVDETLAKNAKLLRAPFWFVLRNSISKAKTKKPVPVTSLYDRLIREVNGLADIAAGDDELNVEIFPEHEARFQVDKTDLDQWCSSLAEKRILERIEESVDGNGEKESYYQLRHDILVSDIRDLDPRLALRFPKNVSIDEQTKNPYQGLKQYDHYEEGKSGQIRKHIREKRSIGSIPKLYGREAIINEHLKFLKDEKKCLVIVGDSGTGKSSLVKGGLLPAMQQQGFETKTLQPGPDLEKFRDQIEDFISTTTFVSSDQTNKKCLYIDQFEECYTFRDSTKEQKDQFTGFLNFLKDKIEEAAQNFKLIISIRHDYAHEFDRNISDWRKYKRLLRYPNQDEIFDIIVGPAYDRGISFEPAHLPEVIAADAANTSYFLPLLSFTMQTLYKREVKKPLKKESAARVCLTEEGYKSTGKIVECLQKEFTDAYNDLKEEQKAIFPQLMARMIVIKDTIPKAQPLAISRISYLEPGKVDLAQEVLNKFTSQFLRIRAVDINKIKENCYEPIHDSLLVYCSEIRLVVNTVQSPESQMYLQPRLEAIANEWKAALKVSDENEGNSTTSKSVEVIQKRYKELEPLFDLVGDDRPGLSNWLFKDEFNLVLEASKYSASLEGSEKLATKLKVRELELEKEQHDLKEKKFIAERNLLLEVARRREHEFKYNELLLSEAAKLKSRRRLNQLFIIILASIIVICGLVIYYEIRKKEGDVMRLRAELESKQQFELNEALRKQQKLLTSQKKSLEELNRDKTDLIAKLKTNEIDLTKAIDELKLAQRNLTAEILKKDSAITERDVLNTRLVKAYDSVSTVQKRVDSLKSVKVITLAQIYRIVSPSLSYRLADHALQERASDSVASAFKASLIQRPQYFESLIVNNVTQMKVSDDGNSLLTLEADRASVNETIIRFWDTNGKPLFEPVKLAKRVTTADFSYDAKKVLVTTENSFDVIDLLSKKSSSTRADNLLYAGFSDTDNQIFAISNNRITVYDIFHDVVMETSNTRFENDGTINNAKLSGNLLTVITPRGLAKLNLNTPQAISSVKYPQSFILNDGMTVLAMYKPLITFGSFRHLAIFDSTWRISWKVKISGKEYNLVTAFTNNNNGRAGIIKFNKSEDFIQATQQLQTQLQIDIKQSAHEASLKYSPEDLYYIDFRKKTMVPIYNQRLVAGRFVLTSEGDSILDYSTESIVKYPVLKANKTPTVRPAVSISENTRFRQIALAGKNGDLIVSLDANNQLKLWRYGRADELEKQKQLWQPTREEIAKIISVDR
jgi:energy-coupling factor transporter ATP-binding protein EcfA2